MERVLFFQITTIQLLWVTKNENFMCLGKVGELCGLTRLLSLFLSLQCPHVCCIITANRSYLMCAHCVHMLDRFNTFFNAVMKKDKIVTKTKTQFFFFSSPRSERAGY